MIVDSFGGLWTFGSPEYGQLGTCLGVGVEFRFTISVLQVTIRKGSSSQLGTSFHSTAKQLLVESHFSSKSLEKDMFHL